MTEKIREMTDPEAKEMIIKEKVYRRITGLGTGFATKGNAQSIAKRERNKGYQAVVRKITYKGKIEYQVYVN